MPELGLDKPAPPHLRYIMPDGASPSDDEQTPAPDAGYRTVAVLSSGEYSDYRVHCAFENPADAERAAATLNEQGRYPDWEAETLPVMPDGRLPRRVTRYTMAVSEHNIGGGLAPVLIDQQVWEWEAPGACHRDGARFTGTDKELVVREATAYLRRARGEHE